MPAIETAHPYPQGSVACVISNVRYYDTAERVVKRADIKIVDDEIIAIARPGTLSALGHVNGTAFVCLPGLVNACLSDELVRDSEPENPAIANAGEVRAATLGDILLQATSNGVTTVGLFGLRVEETLSAITRAGVRAGIFLKYSDLWLGPAPGPVTRDTAECLRDYEHTAQRFDSARLAILPAVGSQVAASTHLLVGLHDLARKTKRRLVVCVDGGAPWTDSFKDAYGCSGLGLLGSLDVLDENTLIVPTASMSFHDRERLRKSPSYVVYPTEKLGAQTGQRDDTARAGIPGRPQAGLGWGWRGKLTDIRLMRNRVSDEMAGDVIDLLTWKGAKALTFSDTGTLAVGKHADLLLYDGHLIADNGQSATHCTALLDMVCRHRPRAVLIDGRWVVVEKFPGNARGQQDRHPALLPQYLRDTAQKLPRLST